MSRIVTWLTLLADQMSDEHWTERQIPKLLVLPRYLGGGRFHTHRQRRERHLASVRQITPYELTQGVE